MEINRPTEHLARPEPASTDTAGAAAILGVSESWLTKDRTSDKPPTVPFVKLGRRVIYSPSVLRRLVEGR
jgi:hypothetical protein